MRPVPLPPRRLETARLIGPSACSAIALSDTAPPSQHMPFAQATATAGAPRSIFLKVTAHERFQATRRPLWQDTRTRHALSEGRASLGRAHRLGPCPGQELALYGLRVIDPLGRLCRRIGLAVRTRNGRALGCSGRPPGPGPIRRSRDCRLSPYRSPDRLASWSLHRTGPLHSGRRDHRPAELAASL